MALTSTTLAAVFLKNSSTFSATAVTGATIGGIVRVNGEYSFITAINGLQVEVRSRGSFGGIAADHALLSPVTFGLTTDLAEMGVTETVPVPSFENLASIGEDTAAIAVPTRNTTYFITKATALATNSTMANPIATQDGLEVQFISNTAAAHVVKLVTSDAGVTGGNKTTYTFAAFAGAGFRVKAFQGRWLTIASLGVTAT